MAKDDTTPKALKPFLAHGVDLQWSAGSSQAVGTCPWCGKEKFYVNVEKGLWDCKVCGLHGNDLTFIRTLHERAGAPDEELTKLSAERGIGAGELLDWGLKYNVGSGGWIFPGFDGAARMTQLYKYGRNPRTKKRLMYATGGLKQALLGVDLYDAKKPDVFLCEGHWDGPALREALGRTKEDENGNLKVTGNPLASLLARANVLATPGSSVWDESWAPLFAGKNVFLMFDSDRPKKACTNPDCQQGGWDTTVTPTCPKCGNHGPEKATQAGPDGARRIAEALAGNPALRPETISVLTWGPAGYDPELTDGYDVRDALADGVRTGAGVPAAVEALLARIAPMPDDWVPGRDATTKAAGGTRLKPEPCSSYAELVKCWMKPMKWSDDLDHMLSCFLAAVLSTETRGEQIWILGMAPPSSGKTTICEAIAVAEEYVYCQNELQGVFSGYKDHKDDNEDHGIIPKIDNKTLVVMDGDPILKDPNRGKILSQYRALFDGVGRKKYNNGKEFNHRARFTFILAGTGSMMEMDSAEAGGRWINVRFKDETNLAHTMMVARRVAFREIESSRVMVTKDEETRVSPEMAEAKKRTGGYVCYLRRNAAEIMAGIEMEDDDVDKVIKYSMFVAYLRARPSKTQEEVAECEAPFRLVAQYSRLAMCLAGVLNKTRVDDDVVARVRRVALDTARGRAYNVCRLLARCGRLGQEVHPLVTITGEDENKLRALLRFMRKIGAIEQYTPDEGEYAGVPRWRLTDIMADLWTETVTDA